MVLNQDFREFITLLNAKGVKYLVIGGYAVAFHGYPRYTKDIDFWVWLNEENALRMLEVLREFGFDSLKIRKEDFLNKDMVIQLGFPPNRIDLLTDLDALEFETCYQLREELKLDDLTVNFIDVESLITTKKASGRTQDLADVEKLEIGRKKNHK
ncbi:MAG: nucleotidyltransferase [Bacteroidia bacterium]|nr:nucleotidyltransferase [Bacteroidia bacterium]